MSSTEQQIDDAVAKRHIQGSDTCLGAQSENLDMNLYRIIGLADPIGDLDGANKQYVLAHGGGGGYTHLSQFVDETAWRLFYSDADGDIQPLALGIADTFLKSIGVDGVPVWAVPAGGGNVNTSGSPLDDDFAKFTDATHIEGRSYAEVRGDLNIADGAEVNVQSDWNQANNALDDYIKNKPTLYTDLTDFVDQTAWRIFYSNADGDVIELVLGTSGQYLKSNGAAAIPSWDTPAGAGDVVGPGSATANAVVLFDGTTGKLIKDSTRLVENVLMADNTDLSDGHAIIAYGDANWSAAGNPGGADTQVQYNNGGTFGGCAQMFWDDVNNLLGINTTTLNERLCVDGAIRLGTTALTNAGAIRWTGTDFEGYKTSWVSLTASGTACINVKDHGAVGDGATDDATAFQNALNAAITGEKCVIVPEGTYIIGTTLTIDDDITLKGIGWGSILKAKSTLSGAILTNKDHHPGQNQYVTISDLYFDGNKIARAAGYCLHFNNFQWSRITNVKIENSPSYGIYLDGSSAFCDEVTFTDCLFRYNENSGVYFYVSSANMMVNCSFFSNNMVTGYGAVSINGGSQNVINGCSIMSNHLHGVFLASSYSNIIEGCAIINNKHHGIYLGTNANDNVVANNTCDGNSSGASGVYSGIVLEGAALRNAINSNRCYNGLYTSNTQQYGVIETGAADYNAIVGNVLKGNLSNDLVVVGTHTKAYHNVDVADGGGSGNPGGSDTHIQYNDSGSFGGEADFRWIYGTNNFNLANAEIQSLDSVPGNFSLDSSPFLGAWTGWTYRGANVIKVQQNQTLPTNGSDHYFVDGLQICHYDSDITNYQSGNTQHEMHAVNIDMHGVVSSVQYKDMIGLSVRTLGRIGWNARGVGAITCETKQFGSGIAANEFHVFNPAAAEGGYEQSTSMAGLQIVMHPHMGDGNLSTNLYRGLMIDNLGKDISAGIAMNSQVDSYGSGYMLYALYLGNATVKNAAIAMPQSAPGFPNAGTIIAYDTNDYTYYDRSSNTFQFVINTNFKMSVDSTRMFMTSANVELNTYGQAFKGKDSGGTMLNLIYAGANQTCMVGAYCNQVSLGAGSSWNDPIVIRVNGTEGKVISVDGINTAGSGFRALRVPN